MPDLLLIKIETPEQKHIFHISILTIFHLNSQNINKQTHIKMQREQLIHQLTNSVQSSTQVWPAEQKARDELSIPLSLTLRPLEIIDSDIQASFSGNNINQYRCSSCKAFVNSKCTIRSKYQYDCSMCASTNRLKTPIDSLAPQFTLPTYTCTTKSLSFRHVKQNMRTFAFAIDLSSYMDETKTIVSYVVDIIRSFILKVRENYGKGKEQNKETSRIQIIIFGFNDHLFQYRVMQTELDSNETLQDEQHEQESQVKKKQKKQNFECEVQKIVDTHLGMDHQDIITEKDKYFIQLPVHHSQVEQILDDLLGNVNNNVGKQRTNSNAMLPALQRILSYTQGCMGKIFVVTGFRNSKGPFVTKIENQPEEYRSNFTLNKQKCLSERLLFLLEKTQMSVSFFIYNSTFVNLLPLYAITKMVNGELRHYNPHNHHQFYYQFHHAVENQTFQLATETVLRVRYSSGVKLVGIFGQHRSYKGMTDQAELISCSPNRIYMFQFVVQGKIQQPYINIQFSILYTDPNGNRVFKIVTHCQKISNNRQQVLDSINYGVVNQSYLWAVLHNMDLRVKTKNLQITLQQRCRKHIQTLQKYNSSQKQLIKKCTPYIMFTYYLIAHFIFNTSFGYDRIYDKSIETRSRILTNDVSGIYAVWPVVYTVSTNKIKVVELKFNDIKDSDVAVVIDQADFSYVFIVSDELRNQIIKKKINENKQLSSIIQETPQLASLSGVLKQIREDRPCGYTQIILLESLQGAYILDQQGPKGYDNFVNNLVS